MYVLCVRVVCVLCVCVLCVCLVCVCCVLWVCVVWVCSLWVCVCCVSVLCGACLCLCVLCVCDDQSGAPLLHVSFPSLLHPNKPIGWSKMQGAVLERHPVKGILGSHTEGVAKQLQASWVATQHRQQIADVNQDVDMSLGCALTKQMAIKDCIHHFEGARHAPSTC